MHIYIVIHEHDHGTSTYLVSYTEVPTESQVIRCLDLDFEPSKGEFLTIDRVPDNEPITLTWQDSDAEDFKEPGVDDDEEEEEEEHRFLNHYRCTHDDPHRSGHGKPVEEWSSTWSCMCNEKCPICNAEIEPYQSDEL